MALSGEMFGEYSPAAFKEQPKPTTRRGELSDIMFPREAENGASFAIKIDRAPAKHVPAELSVEEGLGMALSATRHMSSTRGELADRFRAAGFEDTADRMDARTEAELQRREAAIQTARDELDALYN